MTNIIAQLIGFIGYAFLLTAFQFKDKKKVLILLLLSAFIRSIHFYMIGALTGFSLTALDFILLLVLNINENKKLKLEIPIATITVIIYTAIGILTYTDITSILIVCASTLSIIVLLFCETKYYRMAQFIISPSWWTYNLINGSIAGILTETVITSSAIIGYLRLDRKKLKRKIKV